MPGGEVSGEGATAEPFFEMYDGLTLPGTVMKVGVAQTPEDLQRALDAAATAEASTPPNRRAAVGVGSEAFLSALGADPNFVTLRSAIHQARLGLLNEGLREHFARLEDEEA